MSEFHKFYILTNFLKQRVLTTWLMAPWLTTKYQGRREPQGIIQTISRQETKAGGFPMLTHYWKLPSDLGAVCSETSLKWIFRNSASAQLRGVFLLSVCLYLLTVYLCVYSPVETQASHEPLVSVVTLSISRTFRACPLSVF